MTLCLFGENPICNQPNQKQMQRRQEILYRHIHPEHNQRVGETSSVVSANNVSGEQSVCDKSHLTSLGGSIQRGTRRSDS
jgi:hypothetical protein